VTSNLPNKPNHKTALGYLFLIPLVLTLIYLAKAFLNYHHLASLTLDFWLINIVTLPICGFGISSAFSDELKFVKFRMSCFIYSGITFAGIIISVVRSFGWKGSFFEKLAWVLGLPFGNLNPWVYLHGDMGSRFLLIGNLINFLTVPLFLVLGILKMFQKPKEAKHDFANFQLAATPQFTQPIQSQGVQMNTETNSNQQWLVKMPGQPDNAVDTATLQMWARSGVIRPDTLIVEVKTGMTWQASQINGIFSDKSYVTALLLSFFLGYLGVDRFYLGHTGIGIGKLLTFGGCGIWSLIDFILIAARKVPDSQGNPLA